MFNPNIGDTVYYVDKYSSQINNGIVMKVEPYNDTMFTTLQGEQRKITRLIEDIFETHDKAKEDSDMKTEVIKEEYRQLIPDVPALIRFMLETAVCRCEEFTDWTAREVAMEKAKELLNMEFSE